jgi:citrate synthase
MLEDGDQKIARPRQVYTGAPLREYVSVDQRVKVPQTQSV